MIDSPESAFAAILTVHQNEAASLAPDTLEKFFKTTTKVDLGERIIEPVEFVYARADEFSTASKMQIADVADFIISKNIYAFGYTFARDPENPDGEWVQVEGRGPKIAQVLCGQTVEDAPEPRRVYLAESASA